MKLERNFDSDEFRCKCKQCVDKKFPPEVLKHLKILAKQLQMVRDAIGKPIVIYSGYRCQFHNTNVGGAKNSQHLLGIAADIHIDGKSPKEVHALVEQLMDKDIIMQGGLGLYDSFVHYDYRGKRTRW